MDAAQIAAAARTVRDQLMLNVRPENDLAVQIARQQAAVWERFAIEIEGQAVRPPVNLVRREPKLHDRARPQYPEPDEVAIVRGFTPDGKVRISWLPNVRDNDTTEEEWLAEGRIVVARRYDLLYSDFPGEVVTSAIGRALLAGDANRTEAIR